MLNSEKNNKEIIHASGRAGGVLVGRRHSDGGIKAVNKSTGQPLEMEGGEVVITRDAVSDGTKREFEGEMLTNREILSRINQSGGGVSFEDGGQVPDEVACYGNKYKFGGRVMYDYDIVMHLSEDPNIRRKALSNYYASIEDNDSEMFKVGGEIGCGCDSYERGGSVTSFKYFKGVDHDYANQFEINKAIEELVESKEIQDITIEEKAFIGYFSGYGGLEKFGATGIGLKYEYFTPSEVAKRMWGLAYKHGFKGGFVLEPSCGIGEFIKYAPEQEMVYAFEINKTSAKIASILYPSCNITVEPFEKTFIKNNYTIRGDVKKIAKYSLVIGNPPYGSMGGLYAGMGEKDYTKASNYIDYFIIRGLDMLKSGGILVYVIGTEVANGGVPFLKQGITNSKKMIAERAELVDAYRLPNGIFERTDVLTDIVVFKKK